MNEYGNIGQFNTFMISNSIFSTGLFSSLGWFEWLLT